MTNYLKTPSCDRLISASGKFLILGTWVQRYLDLLHPLEAHAREGYELYALNIATDVETYLGFIKADAAPLRLSGVTLADGRYWISVRLSGYYWKDHRALTRFPVWIVGGEVFEPLPVISNLDYLWQSTQTLVSWTWLTAPGDVAPTDFAVWTSLTSPVNITGAPAVVVPAGSPGVYTATLNQTTALYVAVCSRKASDKGAVAELLIPAPPADLDAPNIQTIF